MAEARARITALEAIGVETRLGELDNRMATRVQALEAGDLLGKLRANVGKLGRVGGDAGCSGSSAPCSATTLDTSLLPEGAAGALSLLSGVPSSPPLR